MEVNVTRKLESTQFNGQKNWLVTASSESPRGTTVDSFYIDNPTLKPLKRIMNQPQVNVTLNFEPEKVTGSMEMRGRKQDVTFDTDKQILAMPEVITRAMDLNSDFKAGFSMLNIMQQKAQPYTMEVQGQETVEVPEGSHSCYKVKVSSSEGGTPTQTLFFTVEQPHRLIKAVNELPANMGGVTVVSELKAVE